MFCLVGFWKRKIFWGPNGSPMFGAHEKMEEEEVEIHVEAALGHPLFWTPHVAEEECVFPQTVPP